MKAHLAFQDRDLDPAANLPFAASALVQDLEVNRVLVAMAAGDRYLYNLIPHVLFASLEDPGAIRYRQEVLVDFLRLPDLARSLYALAVDALESERKVWGIFGAPDSGYSLHRAISVITIFVGKLRELREIAQASRPLVDPGASPGCSTSSSTELDEAYLAEISAHARRLEFREGVPMSAGLGESNESAGHALRRPTRKPSWRERIGIGERSSHVFEIDPRDEAGAMALTALRNRGVALAALAARESAEHIGAYFRQLRAEVGFYVGCLNLHEALSPKGEPTCMPTPMPASHPVMASTGLYDVALSLSIPERVVGSDVVADGRSLLVITGANRGGKSTFLRSLGLAHLMMQCGMFVAAESFAADIRPQLFTHFKREEDASLERGKLDEELARLSHLVDHVGPGSLVLLNKSFASTNEREGSQIGRQVVHALVDAGVKVALVTHLFDLAESLRTEGSAEAMFLRAERRPDGERTFRLVPGDPLPTSHGEDIYRRVFGPGDGSGAPGGPIQPTRDWLPS